MTGRYDRQESLPEIGPEGQRRLRQAGALIVGVGGLGCPVAQYLCGAGIGRLGLVDSDTVSLTNLHRQVLYRESEVGQPKAACAAQHLRDLNSEVEVVAHNCRLDEGNVDELLESYGLVIDGTDNYASRYLIDDAARRHGIPYLYGAVAGMEGQVAVFGYGAAPRYYRDLYPVQPADDGDKSILGPVPAVIGGVMASEAIRLLSGSAPALASRLWSLDIRTMQSFVIDL